MKLEIVNDRPWTPEDIRKITKRWYNEQRGRILGNTTFWDDLDPGARTNIMDDVEATLESMLHYATPKQTPHETRT